MRNILLDKVRNYRQDFDRCSGRIKISKTQLKKFKITQENCDLYSKLELSVGQWMSCLDVNEYINELTTQGLIYQAVRFLK